MDKPVNKLRATLLEAAATGPCDLFAQKIGISLSICAYWIFDCRQAFRRDASGFFCNLHVQRPAQGGAVNKIQMTGL